MTTVGSDGVEFTGLTEAISLSSDTNYLLAPDPWTFWVTNDTTVTTYINGTITDTYSTTGVITNFGQTDGCWWTGETTSLGYRTGKMLGTTTSIMQFNCSGEISWGGTSTKPYTIFGGCSSNGGYGGITAADRISSVNYNLPSLHLGLNAVATSDLISRDESTLVAADTSDIATAGNPNGITILQVVHLGNPFISRYFQFPGDPGSRLGSSIFISNYQTLYDVYASAPGSNSLHRIRRGLTVQINEDRKWSFQDTEYRSFGEQMVLCRGVIYATAVHNVTRDNHIVGVDGSFKIYGSYNLGQFRPKKSSLQCSSNLGQFVIDGFGILFLDQRYLSQVPNPKIEITPSLFSLRIDAAVVLPNVTFVPNQIAIQLNVTDSNQTVVTRDSTSRSVWTSDDCLMPNTTYRWSSMAWPTDGSSTRPSDLTVGTASTLPWTTQVLQLKVSACGISSSCYLSDCIGTNTCEAGKRPPSTVGYYVVRPNETRWCYDDQCSAIEMGAVVSTSRTYSSNGQGGSYNTNTFYTTYTVTSLNALREYVNATCPNITSQIPAVVGPPLPSTTTTDQTFNPVLNGSKMIHWSFLIFVFFAILR
eukprot:TRINITY_DN3179_c0_g1_i6.p1 TRINITY_DN3179_c0_g1~~TRINITY_DN3179_c0_g1_i6.p1  ORF type:complete len:665 (+),score=118.26 TRINITY_DN3179_c0_g1_i6:230-1996(+)